jgi:hypothetical protein
MHHRSSAVRLVYCGLCCIAICFAATSGALADEILLTFSLKPTSITLGASLEGGNVCQATSTVSGTFQVDLNYTPGAGGVPMINSISFVPVLNPPVNPWMPGGNIAYPGSMAMTDVHYALPITYDDGTGSTGTAYVPSSMKGTTSNITTSTSKPVTNGRFSWTTGSAVDLVSGILYADIGCVIDPNDPGDQTAQDNFAPKPSNGGPIDGGGARHLALSDFSSSSSTWSSIAFTPNESGSYTVTLNLLGRVDGFIEHSPEVEISSNLNLVATATYGHTPEPGTLAMLVGLAASLAVWSRKRRAR